MLKIFVFVFDCRVLVTFLKLRNKEQKEVHMLSLSIVVLAGNLAIKPTGREKNELLFPILFPFSVQLSQNSTKKELWEIQLFPKSFRWLEMKYLDKIGKEKLN